MLSANDPIHSMTIKYRYNGAVRELTARHVDLISRNPHIPRICTHNTPPLRGPAPPQITYHVQPGSQENWQINFLLIDTRTVYCCTRIYPDSFNSKLFNRPTSGGSTLPLSSFIIVVVYPESGRTAAGSSAFL